MGRRAKQPDDGLEFSYKKLRTRRRELDVSQRKLSAEIGADANTVGGWERGTRRNYGLEQAIRAAIRLGTRIEDLFAVTDYSGDSRWPRRHRERD